MKNSTTATAQEKAFSAEEILKHLMSFDDASHFRKILQTTTLETIVRDDDEESRCEVYNYFIALDDFFEKFGQYQDNQLKLKIAS